MTIPTHDETVPQQNVLHPLDPLSAEEITRTTNILKASGKFTPGMHVPILPVEAIAAARPDFILILPWNLSSEIISQMAYVSRWGARFIVPIPEARVIAPEELSS